MDVAKLAELLHETEERHGVYESTHPEHNWWDWYAPYLNARIQGARQMRQPPQRVSTWRTCKMLVPVDFGRLRDSGRLGGTRLGL